MNNERQNFSGELWKPWANDVVDGVLVVTYLPVERLPSAYLSSLLLLIALADWRERAFSSVHRRDLHVWFVSIVCERKYSR